MTRWLAMLAVGTLGASSTAQAQVQAVEVSASALPHEHAANPRLIEAPDYLDPPRFADGMLTEDPLATNAMVGLGLAKMHGRARDGSDMRPGAPVVQTRNPGVSFVLKF